MPELFLSPCSLVSVKFNCWQFFKHQQAPQESQRNYSSERSLLFSSIKRVIISQHAHRDGIDSCATGNSLDVFYYYKKSGGLWPYCMQVLSYKICKKHFYREGLCIY